MASKEKAARRLALFQVGQFALAGIAVLVIVGFATLLASKRVGEREAIAEARTITLIKAEGVVRPLLTSELLTGNTAARARMTEVVRRDVLDTALVRVKVWREDGTIVFSDEPALIGQRRSLEADQVDALRTGRISAETSDLSKPENAYERRFGRLLEVYLPLRAQNGERVLFEAYYRTDALDASGGRLWRSFAPISLGALIVLQLVQLPLAWSLATRLGQRLQERERLLSRALEASDVERRRVASDLHDGAVQDLAGVAFSLSGAAIERGRDPATAQLLESSAGTVRDTIIQLRSLIVDIYPPDLQDSSFESALRDLVSRAEDHGVRTGLEVGLTKPLPDPVARLLYRAAQEGVRNVLKHAGAKNLTVSVASPDGVATLEVADDGRGIPVDAGDRREGHMGIAALRGLVQDAGGRLSVESNDPRGTRLLVEVPL